MLAVARLSIASVHLLCLCYYIAAGYVFRKLPSVHSAQLFSFWDVTIPIRHFGTIGQVHYALAACHALFVLKEFWMILRPTSEKSSNSLQRRLPGPLRFLYVHLFTRQGIFGIENRHFDSVFLVREVIETILQTYQAYQLSLLLPRDGLLWFYVTLLVLSCWSTPVLHFFVVRKPLQRLLCRLCDTLLDMIASIGVPLVLALGYWRDVDVKTLHTDHTLRYDVAWIIRAVNESPLIFFGSWFDAFNRLVFSLGLLSSLRVVRGMLVRKPQDVETPLTREFRPLKTRESVPHLVHLAHRFLFGFGAVVIVVQLHAQLRTDPGTTCVLLVRPWLTRKPACAMVEFNCYTNRSMVGSATDVDAVLGRLEPSSLEQIVVRHCRQLEIPPRFTSFHNLFGLKTYNSTVATWSDETALTQRQHPRIRYTYFVRTQFANNSLPAGMLSRAFPRQLLDVEFSVTNINHVPEDLDERWPPLMALLLEKSQLQTYPLSFSRSRFMWLGLDGNNISRLPPEAMTAPLTTILTLNGNPLETLPEAVDTSGYRLEVLSLGSTGLKWLPSWMDEAFFSHSNRFIVGTGSPVCSQHNASVAHVVCVGMGSNTGIYPVEVEIRPEETW